jgi:hypothetical protein
METVERHWVLDLWENCLGRLHHSEQFAHRWLLDTPPTPICILPGWARGEECTQAMVALCVLELLRERVGEERLREVVSSALRMAA